MSTKLDAILQELEKVKSFTEGNCLATTHFVIFLLFGCNEDQRYVMSTKADKLIADRQAFAMIDAAEDSGELVKSVEAAIEKVSDAQISVESLTKMHICPVVFSDKAEPSQYGGSILAVSDYLKKCDIQAEWKSFLILDTMSDNAADWLDVIMERIRAFGSMHSCRCCVLTRKDENMFSVAEERLLTTVLFVAFLNTVQETQEEIGRQIVWGEENPADLFYTAQTAFVENPAVTRVFNRMSGLLRQLCEPSSRKQNVDMSFMQDILQRAYDKMPKEDGYVSLLPLYSVMPGVDFEMRLKRFAYKHYLNPAGSDKEKKEVFVKITAGLLNSYTKSGQGIAGLRTLVGSREEFDKLCTGVNFRGVNVRELPAYPGRQDAVGVFDDIASRLRAQLGNIGRKMLESYFESAEFQALPEKYHKVQEELEHQAKTMDEIIRKRSKQDITLPLLNDPDEKWIGIQADDSATTDAFHHHFCYMALAETAEAFEQELSLLLDRLFKAAKNLSGGNDAQVYMRLVSDTCADVDSTAAKRCVTEIGDKLRFPIRVQGNIGREPSFTYVWGSEENNLYTVWDKYHEIINTDSRLLPMKSNERFAILRVSAPFSRQKILSVDRNDDGGRDDGILVQSTVEQTGNESQTGNQTMSSDRGDDEWQL